MKKIFKKIISLTTILSFTFLFYVNETPNLANAAPGISKFEQQINILNGEFSTTNATDSPTDNSFGLIYFDSSDYDGDTVYFEAIIKCDSCTGGGNNRVTASLYSDSGSQITTVNSTSSSYELVRSGSISISADEYTVRFKRDDDTGTAYIKSARLVITQSAGIGIENTETHIEVGNYESTTNTSATQLTGPKFYEYDDDKFSGTKNAYFEATLKSNGTATTSAELYNTTNSAVVATVSTSSSNYTRVRSSALSSNWDTTNDDEYVVRIYSSDGGNTAYISNAKIIIDQNETNGVTKLELAHQLINTTRTQTNTSYTEDSYINEYTPSNYNTPHTRKIYYEATMKTSGSTGYTALYNTSDTDQIDDPTSSELTTTSTSYERKISSNFSDNTDWPAATKSFTPILKASSSETTSVSSSRILIEIANIDPSFTVNISGVAVDQTHNSITTTVATTTTEIDFGSITPGTPEYAAHEIAITTNDANISYTVLVKLTGLMQGNYPGNNIDPFVGNSATWESPQTWLEPTGTVRNSDTGWLGGNTTDTDVSGWGSGASKFGPIGTSDVVILQSNTGDNETEYITYGIEVNSAQPADLYSATLIYSAVPVY